jgi:hypothetical protein
MGDSILHTAARWKHVQPRRGPRMKPRHLHTVPWPWRRKRHPQSRLGILEGGSFDARDRSGIPSQLRGNTSSNLSKNKLPASIKIADLNLISKGKAASTRGKSH